MLFFEFELDFEVTTGVVGDSLDPSSGYEYRLELFVVDGRDFDCDCE